jgi:hypothetical protein
MKARWTSMVAMSWLFVACGGDKDEQEGPGPNPASAKLDTFKKGSLVTGEDAQHWARHASAPNIYTLVTAASVISSGPDTSREADPACPVETQEGLVTHKKGGCTDKYGVEWLGSVEEKVTAAGLVSTYSGFGYREPVTCGDKSARSSLVYDGSLTMSSGSKKQTFSAQLVTEAVTVEPETCETSSATSAVDYQGTTTGDESGEQSAPSTWNGSGRIGYADKGVISAETRDEVIHSATCESEALSGKTTLTTDGHQAEIQYDGATDCEETATVQWTLDGASQGELADIACSASGGSALAMWGASVFSALGFMRRRSRR